MDADARRNFVAHYTSEEDILKRIKPLFLDALWVEFEKMKGYKIKTPSLALHKKLRNLTFLDPAPGCGNFLIITYRELRLLELAVLRASRESTRQVLDVQSLINVDVDQFYGIEIEEFPAQIALWLTEASPHELKIMPAVLQRVKAVADWRLTSATASICDYSALPTLFTQDRQPKSVYLALPRVSSERRQHIPIDFLTTQTIAHEKLLVIENASLFYFGMLCSNMHNAWMRTVAGRLESRYSYAPAVYNNLPWPELNDKLRANIEVAAQAVLDAHAEHVSASLADLYDPLTMPANLLKAHQILDKAVDAAYGYKGATTDAARVAFLFERYQQITSLLPLAVKPKSCVKNSTKKEQCFT